MKKRVEPPRIGTDEDYQAIEKAAGIETPNDAFRRKLSIHIKYCMIRSEAGDLEVRDATYLKAVRQIREDALRLQDDLTKRRLGGSEEAWAYEYASINLWDELVLPALDQLLETADIMLDVVPPDKGGILADMNFRMLLEGLINYYEEATGRKAGVTYHGTYTGPFVRFVTEVIDRLATTFSRENQALGKALQRYLQQRRKRLGMDKT